MVLTLIILKQRALPYEGIVATVISTPYLCGHLGLLRNGSAKNCLKGLRLPASPAHLQASSGLVADQLCFQVVLLAVGPAPAMEGWRYNPRTSRGEISS